MSRVVCICNKREYRKLFVILFTCRFGVFLLCMENAINLAELWESLFVNYFPLRL